MIPRQSRHGSTSRRWFVRGIGFTASLAALTLVSQSIIVSNATWSDSEWDHAAIGASTCETPEGAFASRGQGRLLSGSLLEIDLDTLAEVRGVETTNNGSRSKRTPQTATALGNHAYSDPLDVNLLSTIGLDAALDIPLDTDTGVIGQYAQATTEGEAVGASGAVTDTGGISLDQYQGDVPDLATVKLSTLLNSPGLGLGDLLQDVTDLELAIGAVGGRAWLDGCRDAWQLPDFLHREYLTSHVDLDLTSPTVAALGTTISDTVDTLEGAAAALVGDGNVLGGVLQTVIQLATGAVGGLTGLLIGLRLDGANATAEIVNINLDLQSIRDLLDEPISDDDGVISITLSEGLVHIDTVALVSAAYEGEANNPYPNGLNGLAPNTEPLKDELVLTELTTRLSGVLGGIVNTVNSALTDALNNAHIHAEIRIPVETRPLLSTSWQSAGDLLIEVSGSLTELLNNASGVVTIDSSALLDGLLGSVVSTLVTAVLGVLTPVLGALVGNVVLGALQGLTALPENVMTSVVNPIVTLVSGVYEDLFLDGIVAVTINAQNAPASGNPQPHDWAGLEQGRYDVSAIRVGVLDSLGASAVMLYLGRGSVGPACSLAQAGEDCVGY